MPLYPHHRHSISDAGHGQTQDNFYSVANALYQSDQTLASAGIPSHQPWQANRPAQPIAQPPIPQNPYTTGNTQGLPYSNGGISRRSSLRYAPPQYQNQQGLGLQPSAMDQYGQHMSFQGNNLNIQGDPASPNRPGGGGAGGAGGGHARQMSMGGSSSIQQHNLPQISTQLHQPPVSSARPPPNHAHSFSNSSPGNMDPATPMYKAYAAASTPDTTQKFVSPTSRGPPSSALSPSYSPLGLADIRSRTDTLMNDVPFSTTGTTQMEEHQYPTNSNYLAPWPIFAVDWCKWPPKSSIGAGKIAIGSYLEDNHNYIQILESHRSPPDPDNRHAERGLEFVKTAQANHSYPVTRILWEPPSSNKQSTDLLATSGDHLRLWSLPSATSSSYSNSISRTTNQREAPLQELSPLALLSNSKSTEHTAPITSLDWNVVQPSLIITSSIDTTCTIWDIPTLTAKTQLIAHDKEVFDVKFCANSVDVFVSCGADGSVRMFDLRSLEHSTIIYEPSEAKADGKAALSPDRSPARDSHNARARNVPFPPPLLRLAASPHDAHLLATFSQESPIIRVLDVRQPGQALLELKGHSAAVNCIEWSHTQRGLLASGGDDSCVLLWDLLSSATASAPLQAPPSSSSGGPGQERGPSAVWEGDYEVSNLSWAPTSGVLGVCGGRGIWGVQL